MFKTEQTPGNLVVSKLSRHPVCALYDFKCSNLKDKKAYVTISTLFSGQEVATIDCDEGVPITPFNLDEEMEEGHFDSEGNYFIKKDQEIRDNWLDNIDWVIVHLWKVQFFLVYCIKQLFENCLL